MPLKLYYLCPYSYFFFLICYELDDEFTLEDIIIPDVFGWYLYLLSLQNRIRGQKQTGVFVLIRFFRVVFILCSFQASKPMWKLYLVWAILSSVILLYIISKRCNVMSTIKTHKMTPVGTVLSFLHLFVLNLPQPAWLSESKFRWKSFTRSQFLRFHFSRLLTPPVCECHLEPCSPLSLNTDGNILCLFIFHLRIILITITPVTVSYRLEFYHVVNSDAASRCTSWCGEEQLAAINCFSTG